MDKMTKKECKEEIMAYMSQHNEPTTLNRLGEIVLANGQLSKRTFRRALHELQNENLLIPIQLGTTYHYMRACDVEGVD